MNKPDLLKKWRTEEINLSDGQEWTITVIGGRSNGEEVLGWGWTPMDEPDNPGATACFQYDEAVKALQTLYAAFAVLDNPDDYLKQIGLDRATNVSPPTAGILGSAQGLGKVQVHADWSQPTNHITFIVYPPEADPISLDLGIESVAHLMQLTDEVFKSLDWPVPG